MDLLSRDWIVSIATVTLLIALHVLEVTCYGVIFHHIWTNDREVSPFISADSLRRRRRQNILTFLNQVAIFGVEVSALVIGMAGIMIPSTRHVLFFYAVLNPVFPLATVLFSKPMREAACELLRIH